MTDAFAARLNQELGLAASAPYNGECWNLCPLEKLAEGNRERLQKPHRDAAAMDALPQRTPPAPAKAPKPADHTTAYGQLVLAGEKLMALIGRMEKRSSKDQARLTRHIHTLVRKFARR